MMLLGRDQERAAIDQLLAEARVGQSHVIALAGALALEPGAARDRFAIGAATLSLVAAHAEAAPVVLLIDDAHWLDGASAEALLFALRRLVADPIAAIVAARDGEPSLLDGADLPLLRLHGIDRDAADALLARAASAPLAQELAGTVYRSTAGNPLALLEFASDAPRLEAQALHGIVPVSERIAEAFVIRARSLSEPARRMLVLAAAGGSGDLVLLERAGHQLGLAVADLAAAEGAGLVRLEHGVIEFRHPLARSAVYGQAGAAERREAHRALAGALPDRDADRRAWHLSSAAIGPDDAASAALEQAAARARARSAYSVAATAYERAARLATSDAARRRLLFASADAAWLAGLPGRAVALLDEVTGGAPDAPLDARVERLRGFIAIRTGPVMRGHAILVAAAERAAAAGETELAVEMLAEAAYACFYAGDSEAMRRTAARAVELLPEQPAERTAFLAAIAFGMSLVLAGAGEDGAASIRDGLAILEASDELRRDPSLLAWTAAGPLWLRGAEPGRALIDQALEVARSQGAVGSLPFLLQLVARDHATSDRWSLAQAGYHEAIALARETGQRVDLAACLAGLAWLEARQGRERDCRAHAAEAREICAELGIAMFDIWANAALGDLELGSGRPAAAVERYAQRDAALRSLGVADVDVLAGPELVEAHLRVGDDADAASVAEEFCDLARAKGQPWALARAAHCRGLLAADGELDREFGEALRFHAETVDAFEEARTQLSYGARLRRARRRVHGREQLRAALETFERLGASPWADQARAELTASGETARRRDATAIDDLTPQELQIALLLAAGKTTREAAATLFLSPKTIEYHLRHAYRKLGISSRAELAVAVAARG
jgi:DNA-binding CsgD family transcriptional regulator